MNEKYIELKQRRDLGDMINVYFDFLKQNIKSFTNIFISYNGIFILILLGISYLLVTGFMGLIKSTSGIGVANEQEFAIYLGIGGLLFFLVFIVIAALNYSLASIYMIKYERDSAVVKNRKDVWSLVTDNLGKIIVFILLLFLIYIIIMIIAVILAFIPIIGTLVQYVINFAVASWFGVSFMVMLYENKSPVDALSEGMDLVKNNFWKCVGVNFILGLLVGLLFFLLIVIPGVVIGLYTFHVVDTGVDVSDSAVAKIIYTFGLCILLVIMAYSQSLSQFINGILYFSLHEEKYNINTREKIDQIGLGE